MAALDLWSKSLWIYPSVGGQPRLEKVVIENWLQIRTVFNTGGVWSIELGRALLKWGTLIAVPLITLWIFWPDRVRRIETAAKALILGGAIGNLWDRFRYGAVRDFIDVMFGDVKGWHWPTFNVADMCLVGGIGLLLILSFVKPKEATA